jgi:hypothetical protein
VSLALIEMRRSSREVKKTELFSFKKKSDDYDDHDDEGKAIDDHFLS